MLCVVYLLRIFLMFHGLKNKPVFVCREQLGIDIKHKLCTKDINSHAACQGILINMTYWFRDILILFGMNFTEGVARVCEMRNKWKVKLSLSLYQATNSYRRSRGMAPLIPNLGSRLRWVVDITPCPQHRGERTPMPSEQETVWAPGPIWTIWRKEKSLATKVFRQSYHPVLAYWL
jgi:hypothetical protein